MQVLQSRMTSARVCTARPSRVQASKPLSLPRSLRACQQRVSKRLQQLRAAEEAEVVTESDDQSSSGNSLQSPFERARAALAADSVDVQAVDAALADLQSELARLQDSASAAAARAATAEAQASSLREQLLRLTADFDNYRRRTASEKDSLADKVRGDVVTELLPIVDNFELARTQVKAETEGEQRVNNSYQGLYKQFVDMMRGLGVEAVPTTGEPFDPNYHDAIMQEESSSVADGTVLQEFRKGFKLGDKLLRPAMVKVAVNNSGSLPTLPDSEGAN